LLFLPLRSLARKLLLQPQSTTLDFYPMSNHSMHAFTTSRKLRLENLEARENPAVNAWNTLDALPTVAEDSKAFLHPEASRPLNLQIADLRSALAIVPSESEYFAGAAPVEITIPAPDGSNRRFGVYDAPVMAPELAAQFPEIRTYQGYDLDNPTDRIRMDITPQGFHAQVLSPNGAWYIDPYLNNRDDIHISYFRKDLSRDSVFELSVGQNTDEARAAGTAARGFNGTGCTCALCAGFNIGDDTTVASRSQTAQPFVGPVLNRSGTQLRTYRLAVAATGEYTAFHGGTVALGQAAIVTAMNRVVGVYETELSIRMVLVANNSSLVYTDAATDPYTNNNGGTMLGQNQTNVTNIIGTANFDIGHVFSTGGGGVASLGSVGINSAKARGVTGLGAPINDPFTIDYVAHEMGHQFGANHTFNTSSDSNRNASTAYEPGSGSTIMAYAGITGANSDLQPNSDPYFNFSSFNEIIAHVDNVIPGVGLRTATGNTVPTVNAGLNYAIPTNTPFELTATGSDADGDALTYSWEQMDLGVANLLNSADNGTSPLFRVRNPTASPTRTFPRLSDLVNNTNTIPLGEKMPTVARPSMDFRVTVRDNRANGGGVNTDDMFVNVVNTGASFAVTAPNTAVNWNAGSTQNVTWNVAGTTAAPISTGFVNILLSTDGGFTYPITLISNVANDGAQAITVPNVATTQARVRVQPVNNIYFDISNVNFTITPPPNAPPVITSNGGGATANIAAFEDNVAVTTVTATDADAGAILTYSISGGVDAGDFTINPTTGVLTFVNPPDPFAPADANGDNVYLVTVRVSDGIANDTQALTVTVNSVNDAPNFTPGADIYVPFVAGTAPAYSYSNWATNLSTGEPAIANQTLTFFASNDNNAIFAVQPSVSPTGTLSFTPTDGATGIANVSIFVQDNGGTANGGVNQSATFNFIINVGVNAAPVLDNAGEPELLPVGVDATTSSGTKIGDLIAGKIIDLNGDPKGIAVVGLTETSMGRWEFSIDSGTTWSDLETASPTTAVLLRDNDRARFIPNAGFMNIRPTMTYRAWDQTAGVPGGSADTTTTGGTSPFSIALETATLRVAPLLATINEDQRTTGTILKGFIAANNFNDTDAKPRKGMAIVAAGGEIPGAFEISSNGITWKRIDPIVGTTNAFLVPDTGRIRFVPAPNLSGDVYIRYHAWDQTQGTSLGNMNLTPVASKGAATAFSNNSDYAVIRVKPLNDRPVLDTLTTTFVTPIANTNTNPVGDRVSTILGATATDYDRGTVPGIAVTGTSKVGGFWQYSSDNGVTWFGFGTVSAVRAVVLNPDALVRFLPNANYVGKPTFTYRAWDRTNPLTTGTANINTALGTFFSIGTETATCVVSAVPVLPVNNAPTLNPVTPTFTAVVEDSKTHKGDTISTLISPGIVDIDTNPLKGIAVTNLTGTTTGSWQYSINNGVSWRAFTLLADDHALLLKETYKIRYVPNLNFNGTATITYRAWDQTRGTANTMADLTLANTTGGSTPFSNSTQTASVTVTPVNDAPVMSIVPTPTFTRIASGTGNSLGNTVSELIGNSITDVDSTLRGIAITRVPIFSGVWQYSIDNGTTWTNLIDAFGPNVSTTAAVFLRPQDKIRLQSFLTYKGIDSISYKAWDQSTGEAPGSRGTTIGKNSISVATETAAITVGNTNFRPVLDIKPVVTFASILNNNLSPVGTLVSSLLGSAVIDADLGRVTGIAVTGATTIGGTWQYSIDAGSTWSSLTGTSVYAGRLLRSNDLVRFLPNAGFAGSARLSYKAWDQSNYGTFPSTTVSTLSATNFSAAIESATIAVNAAPTLP
jgi:hypothetical protein